MSRGAAVDVKQYRGKAETKTKSGEDPASTPSCLPVRNVRCGARRGWEKGTDLLDIALTERETEARCPDLLGAFCWVLFAGFFAASAKYCLIKVFPGKGPSQALGWGLLQGSVGTHRDLNKPHVLQQEQGKQFPSSVSRSQRELNKVDVA